jgi:signal transduction histidine kinase
MQALGQLAGGIAHDFNNILQVVAGSAALIERRPDDVTAIIRIVRRIIDSANRGAAITRRMLIFARRGKLEAEAVAPATLLEGLREICSYTLGPGIDIRVQLAPNLPRLVADKSQLETALVNMATNARDAMPNGGVLTFSARLDVMASAMSDQAGLIPGAYIRLAVSDNGTGMDSTLLARVAEPFFTTKGVGQGTGLGLSMVKGFAEQSGGSFSISSEVGAGTTVSLWLPQATNEAEAGSCETAEPGTPLSAGGRLLLAEGEYPMRGTVATRLEA